MGGDGGGLTLGIDLNGNWGYQFRPSRLACSENYAGTEAFEARETAAMANYLINGTSDVTEERDKKVIAYVDLHSYGQLCEWGGRIGGRIGDRIGGRIGGRI